MVQKKSLIKLGVGIGAGTIVLGATIYAWSSPKLETSSNVLHQDILTTEREVKLSYAHYDPSTVSEISNFEEENDIVWQGNGFYDDRTALGGATSLSLTSTNRELGTTYADIRPLDDIAVLEVAIKITDPDDLESLTVYAGTPAQPHAYRFPVSNLNQQWNIVRMERNSFVSESATIARETPRNTVQPEISIPSWDQVTRIEFDLISRPAVTIIANFDGLRVERNTTYRSDWDVNIESFLALGNLDNQIYLLGRGVGGAVAGIHAVTAAQNFTYQARLIPRNDKKSGLFFRGDFRSNNGYFFWVGGINQSSWGVSARALGVDDVLAVGEINNVRFRKDESIWLKVETKGENIAVFISLDGKNYNKLQDIIDTTYLEPGGVGIYVEGGGEVLFNDFMFSQ